jgi:hypothetical protein
MENTTHNTIDHYLLFFTNKFKEKNTYYWSSSLKNAQHIFFYSLEKKTFEDIIFDDYNELEQDLDFLTEDAREILEITKKENYPRFPDLDDKEKSEILENFKNHIISSWHIDEIFFSCGVYCCMAEFKSQKKPDIFFYFSIYHFLLNNSFSLEFYFFLKQNNILLQDKKEAQIILMSYLSKESCTIEYNKKKTSTFLENFVLIWDLLEYDLSDYISLKKQFTNEIKLNKVELNPTEENFFSTSTPYCDISFIEKYISNKLYKT